MDDELLDEDEPFDFIIYEELERKEKNNSGCLGAIALFLVVGGLLSFKSFISV